MPPLDAERSVVGDVVAFAEVRAFVVGDVLLDEYVAGEVHRISPEAPVPVVVEHGRRAVLGGAANVAAGIGALGALAALAGRVGDDADGERALRLCEEAGIDRAAVLRSPVCTARKTRVLAGWQQLFRIDREDTTPITAAEEDAVVEAFARFAAAGGPRVLVLSDYAKGVVTPALAPRLLALADEHGIPSVVDPKATDLSRYSGCTVMKPNLDEALAVVGEPRPADDEGLVALAEAVRSKSGARNIVMSLAARGVVGVGEDFAVPARFGSVALEISDVSGAGDTMVAVLAAGLGSGLPAARVVELANVAAGAACAKAGTAVLTAAELLSAVDALTRDDTAHKVLAGADEAARWASLERQGGRRVVFTNGCFDILHAGHVRLLAEARAQGDVLVVGLNSDDSVRRLKGPQRPAQTEHDRAAILAGLSAVDAVVVFDDDTPIRLIEAIRPDVLVKGGDYRADEVVGAAELASWGGRVHIVPLLEGRSTTRLLGEGPG